MVAITLVHLRCDNADNEVTRQFAGTPEACEVATGEWDASTVREARRVAKNLGWTYSHDGRDVCGPCAKRRKEGKF
jgi:hypothetical protein